jgi:putative peptide zinc metalloprotease protein
MSRTALSANWFRVASLRPRLRAHAMIERQRFRGADWYVVQDGQTGRFHRVSPAANHMIGLMNGRRSMDEIWQATLRWLGSEAEPPTQDDVIRLLSQLHAADLLAGDTPPDLAELARRANDRSQKAVLSRLRNPLALRFPLIDPDPFLEATVPLVRPVFTVWGFLLWLLVVGAGLVLAALNWAPLTENIADRVLLAENLLLMAVLYPAIKALHELGHGYAAKVWGGAVHEMGLMLLVLIPVPYVDASTASGFESKWRRAAVGGAGILVELFIAGVAMIVWATVEPGLVRAAAFNVALIAGVSTLLFNGNPLLRFDGYYVLCDLIEIPNLASRANRHLQHVVKHWVFGLRESVSPATAPGEAPWFCVYAVSAFAYRVAIMLTIALFVATQLFFVGVLLAVWALATGLIWPVLKGAWWLGTAQELGPRRPRALALSGSVALALLAGFALMPTPYATGTEGVVSPPEAAHVRAGADGVLLRIEAAPGAEVAASAPLFVLEDPIAVARRRVLLAQRQELHSRFAREPVRADTSRQILLEQIDHVEAALDLLDARLAALRVTSPRAGRFVPVEPTDGPGRLVRRGELLGYVLQPGDAVVSAAVPQERADLLRDRALGVTLRLASAPEQVLPGTILREAPKAAPTLPATALGAAGGGAIPIDPRAGDPTRALSPVVQFDVAAPLPAEAMLIGLRAFIRIDHGSATPAQRAWRTLRQLFLSRFDV